MSRRTELPAPPVVDALTGCGDCCLCLRGYGRVWGRLPAAFLSHRRRRRSRQQPRRNAEAAEQIVDRLQLLTEQINRLQLRLLQKEEVVERLSELLLGHHDVHEEEEEETPAPPPVLRRLEDGAGYLREVTRRRPCTCIRNPDRVFIIELE